MSYSARTEKRLRVRFVSDEFLHYVEINEFPVYLEESPDPSDFLESEFLVEFYRRDVVAPHLKGDDLRARDVLRE